MMWASRTGGFLVVVAMALFAIGCTAYVRLQGRHARLNQLYRFGQALAGLGDGDEVVRAVLSEARTLCNAEVAQLVLSGPGGSAAARCHTLRGGGVVSQPLRPLSHPLVNAVDGGQGAVLATRTVGDPELQGALRACGFRDAVAVRLPGDDAAWYLVVADRLGGHVTFDAADVTLAMALASHAALALRGTNLLDRLRREVTVKEHQASHDALTGLANRTLFSAVVDRALVDRADESVVGVMLMDLDGFKELNDTLGHEAGDSFLTELADRLGEVIGDRDWVARLGGDEFAVLLCGADSEAAVVAVADQLSGAVQVPVLLSGTLVEMRASIGVAFAPVHGRDRSSLLRLADVAMYRAKQHGGGVAVYSDRRDDGHVQAPSLIAPLRQAIRTSALELHYQPKADTRTGRVIGAEALLRWTDPAYGPINPEQFIPVAERSGLIRPLTYWVLDTALTQLAAWRREGGTVLDLAVNLSSFSLADPGIVDQVIRLLATHGVPAGSLTLELTESAGRKDHGEDCHVLDRLAGLGVRLSIDDYGTGSSSLGRVMNLPVSEVKIDKSFVTDMLTNETAASIVASTIDLATRLGLTVVAEGVEDLGTWHRLRRMGCDAAQGFLLSRPRPAADFADWLRDRGPDYAIHDYAIHDDAVVVLHAAELAQPLET